MFQVQNLKKSFGGRTLFENISFGMERGERLALIGRNGHGKTTLFRILIGDMESDGGTIHLPRNYKLGYLSQHLKFSEKTISEEAALALPEGEEDQVYQAEAILCGLGFTAEDLMRAPGEFSGGFQLRIHLAKVLISKPDLLLLDEPTNYLDILSVRWLIRFLQQWKQELIVISHDRGFLDSISTHSMIIHRGSIKKIKGTTEALLEQIAHDEEIHERTRVKEDKKRKEVESYIDRFRYKASKAAGVQSRVKMLDKQPALQKLLSIENLRFYFQEQPYSGKIAIDVQELTFCYPNPSNAAPIPLIQNFSFEIFHGDRIGIIGKNGKGKSTLLKLIAGQLKPLSGLIKNHTSLVKGYFGQTNIQLLNPANTVEEEIASANLTLNYSEIRSICGLMMFSGDSAKKSISILSGGEKSRVLLGRLLATPCNMLLLDEPSNHLDIESVEALVESLEDFSGSVLMVTHDEMVLRRVATKLIVFSGDTLRLFDGGYDEFLAQGGWEEEEGTGKESTKSPSQRKEAKRMKAQMVQERSETLSPLKKKIENIEMRITVLERQQEELNNKMILASQRRASLEIREISTKIGAIKLELDRLYKDLEELFLKQEGIEKEFVKRLSDL